MKKMGISHICAVSNARVECVECVWLAGCMHQFHSNASAVCLSVALGGAVGERAGVSESGVCKRRVVSNVHCPFSFVLNIDPCMSIGIVSVNSLA